jgi:4-amino-4-deoxy-L-arabinose transferase-like glycosyltransferase
VVSIGLLALAGRLLYLALASVLDPTGSFFADDSSRYDAMARGLLAGIGYRWEGHPTAFDDPGYPVFLAALYGTVGSAVPTIGVMQAFLGGLTAALIAWTGWRLGGMGAGWAAGGLAAVYPHLVFWTPYVLSETLFVAVLVVALWALVEAQVREHLGWFVAAGVTIGLGVVTRSVLVPFVPIAAACAWWLARGRRRWAHGAAVVAGALIVLLPWTVRNYVQVGIPTPVATKSILVAWQGNSPGATGGSRGYVDNKDFQGIPRTQGKGQSDAEIAGTYRSALTDYLVSAPLSILERMPAKLWNMWRPVYEGSSLRNWIVTGTSYGLLLLLSAVGGLATLRQGRAGGARWYIVALVVTLGGIHAVTTGMIRFRLPIEAALVILAGVGVATLWYWSTQRKAAVTQSR